MKEALSIALVLVLGMAIAAGAALWHVIDETGPARVYADLARWVMLVTLLAAGIAFLRVLLHGLGRLYADRNAHKIQLVKERERIIERHTIDGRPGSPLQLPGLPEPNMAIFPAMIGAAWRQGIEAGGEPGEVIDGEKRELEPARRVWQ